MSEKKGPSIPPASLLLRSLAPMQEEIDSAFGEGIKQRWSPGTMTARDWPAVDLYEVDDSLLLLADLPGVAPEDVEIRIDRSKLVLCGYRWSTGFVKHQRGIFVERRWGRFCRTFYLDQPVVMEKMEQGYENGIYWARFPKCAETGFDETESPT